MNVFQWIITQMAEFGPKEWLLAGIGFLWYMLPTMVSFGKKSPHRFVILVINLFLGWSGLGWLILMLWAVFERKLLPTGTDTVPEDSSR